MIHPTEQDLLMFAHRSIGLFKATSLWIHLRRCPSCRARYAAMSSVSSALATAIRPGMAAWRPVDTMLRMQVLVAALVIGFAVFGTQQLLNARNNAPAALPWDNTKSSASAAGASCETETGTTGPGRPVKAPVDPKRKGTSRIKPRPQKGSGAPAPVVKSTG